MFPRRRSFITKCIALVAATCFASATLGTVATHAEEMPVDQWVLALKQEAMEKGIRAEILDQALKDFSPIARVVELDRKQPEFTLTFQQYLSRVVPKNRVEKASLLLRENRAELEAVSRKYGVQPRFIVALWGIETDFGRLTGGFSVVKALATLAYDGRRSAYFRKELLNALTILNEGHIAVDDMTGSWAGAMGQCQFMPSSFLNFAVDHDGDGRRNIWTSKPDVFASAANYLSKSGWKGDETWGRKVKLPKGFDMALASLKTTKKISEWQNLGVRRADGTDLPKRDLDASIVIAGDEGGVPYMVYNNFKTVLKWNRSTYFATAVGTLADRMVGR